MNSKSIVRTWWAPSTVGLVLVLLLLVAVTFDPTLRHHWPLLVLSAILTAAPVLLRTPPTPPLGPLRPPVVPLAGSPVSSSSAALVASAVSIAKAAGAANDNEDAYGIAADRGYVAVADGASSSYGARAWAQALCDAFLAHRPLDGRPSSDWIGDAAACFDGSTADDTDWYAAAAAQRGAHATFVGLAVVREVAAGREELRWRATAVGDSVLVHLGAPADQGLPIVTAFPIAHSASFTTHPALLSSTSDRHPPLCSIDGSAGVGDTWLLLTDELARWALHKHETGDPVWTLLGHGDKRSIRAAVTAARAARLVEDDDMTVVRCTLMPA